jgi:hypothetical protein
MTPIELSRLSMVQTSRGVRRKEFSPVELAQTCLKELRLSTVNCAASS